MKTVLMTLLLVLWAVGVHGQNLELSVGTRLDINKAAFVWHIDGEDSQAQALAVQCGPQRELHTSFLILPLEERSTPVSNLLNNNGIHFCVLSALGVGNIVLVDSNEVVLELRGKWLTQLQ